MSFSIITVYFKSGTSIVIKNVTIIFDQIDESFIAFRSKDKVIHLNINEIEYLITSD